MFLAAAGECDVYRLIVGIIPVPVYQPSAPARECQPRDAKSPITASLTPQPDNRASCASEM